jgi:hypothetical protein
MIVIDRFRQLLALINGAAQQQQMVVSTPPRVAASTPAAVGNLYGRGARGPQTPPTPVPPAAVAAPVVPVVDAAQLRFEACDPNLDSLVGHPVRNSKVGSTFFGRHGFDQCCGSGSISQRYGSGSFYHHATIVRKTLIRTILRLFLTFYL